MASTQLVPAHQSQTEEMVFRVVKKIVLDSLTTPHSKAAYSQSIDIFLSWYVNVWRAGLSKVAVHAYRQYLIDKGYSPGTVNARLSAVKRLAFEAADSGFFPVAGPRAKHPTASGTRYLDSIGRQKFRPVVRADRVRIAAAGSDGPGFQAHCAA